MIRFDFQWDPRKANSNLNKHGIRFERAATIFRDPNLISIPDMEHSENEERWITMGLDESGTLLVVSHVFDSVAPTVWTLRLISARKAIRSERKQYEKGI